MVPTALTHEGLPGTGSEVELTKTVRAGGEVGERTALANDDLRDRARRPWGQPGVRRDSGQAHDIMVVSK